MMYPHINIYIYTVYVCQSCMIDHGMDGEEIMLKTTDTTDQLTETIVARLQ